ncbi:MAG: hypothetical protein L6R42_008158 [Xanthoria sp. 1 TBL-2021]|nr:MAG: hypothetical protein L6R42_008158 [Xanthoria sp. 1 TBL-2021]
MSADSSIRSPRMLNVIPLAVQRFVDLSMGVEASWPWNPVTTPSAKSFRTTLRPDKARVSSTTMPDAEE